jgi:hypothetical protein
MKPINIYKRDGGEIRLEVSSQTYRCGETMGVGEGKVTMVVCIVVVLLFIVLVLMRRLKP